MPAESRAPRYVLITQCLQNDVLLNRRCRLYVGDRGALKLLVGADAEPPVASEPRLPVDGVQLERGPLGSFLRATIGARLDGGAAPGTLDVINVRDWHVADHSYDRERRAYGAHCEATTWGAG